MTKNEKSKDYFKADQNNAYCFFITIFRLAILAFFRFTDVPEEGWYGLPKYCYEKTIDVILINFPVVFGLLVFGSILVVHLFYSYHSN